MVNEAERNETVFLISFSYLSSDRPFYAWTVILQIDQPPALLVAEDKKALQSHFSVYFSPWHGFVCKLAKIQNKYTGLDLVR